MKIHVTILSLFVSPHFFGDLGDGIITNFGDNLCDDFATICFTQYGDFFVDLPEMVRIEVIKLALYLVTIRVTDCQELDAT